MVCKPQKNERREPHLRREICSRCGGARLKPGCGAETVGAIAAKRLASVIPTSNAIMPPRDSPEAKTRARSTQSSDSRRSRRRETKRESSTQVHQLQFRAAWSLHSPSGEQESAQAWELGVPAAQVQPPGASAVLLLQPPAFQLDQHCDWPRQSRMPSGNTVMKFSCSMFSLKPIHLQFDCADIDQPWKEITSGVGRSGS